ncbi:hypothetical protein HB776_07745 [Tardiphaga robiniae]|uniref:phosphoglycerate mutase (2,3-diphosphoglycerate-dependent) n=2 Tax=Tardiphaga robiniae TaxID=943830 RepID=A0A7G6U8L3_9BRAD|nr:hypothetical protein HB776_07745 [Tardiphaga robiniae]
MGSTIKAANTGIVSGHHADEWPPKRHLLVLARHGKSEGNRDNIFTGWRDLPLTECGRDEARRAAEHLRTLGIAFDGAFATELTRASTSYRRSQG